MLALLWSPKYSAAAHPDPFRLFRDAVDLMRNEVRELKALGCEYIQIDAPELATLVDPATREQAYEAQGISTGRLLDQGIDMLNAVADAPGVTFGLHLCRGNNAGKWMSSVRCSPRQDRRSRIGLHQKRRVGGFRGTGRPH
jgi:5-methyltetrahydropteroyltriglutamate--homocysteine methyltransferase